MRSLRLSLSSNEPKVLGCSKYNIEKSPKPKGKGHMHFYPESIADHCSCATSSESEKANSYLYQATHPRGVHIKKQQAHRKWWPACSNVGREGGRPIVAKPCHTNGGADAK